ncbi:spore coat protein [Niallia sp. Krafla_26]|uniref:spore coat protein n=1 Tax=Niallia sp. Krafla_26 TaxID=3064703 RepID=UPI003D17CA58
MSTMQPQNNMNTGQNMNMTGMQAQATDTKHGGHELMDVHEVLSCAVSTMDQYLLFGQMAKDPELKDMINRQHQFMMDCYNITAECFKSGMNPSHHTTRYAMTQSNDVVYGLTPSEPKKPKMNASEIGDQCITNYMLGLMKAEAGIKTKAALEVTNPVVRRVIADSVPNTIEMAYEIFQYQNKHGYYQVARLDQQDMNTLINSFVPTGSTLQ